MFTSYDRLNGLYQPFMRIWVGEELMLSYGVVICFSVFFIFYAFNRLLNIYKSAVGLWHEDRFRPFITSLVNLSLNLIMVKRFGIYGVILSTVISMAFVGVPWIMNNVFSTLFDAKLKKLYLNELFGFALAITGAEVAVGVICTQINFGRWKDFIICGCISVIIPNVLFLAFYAKTNLFRQSVQLVDRITKYKLMLEKRILKRI